MTAPSTVTLQTMVEGDVSAFTIADIYSVHWSTAYRWIRQLPGYIHKTELLDARLTLLHKKGKTLEEMAEATGYGIPWIRERLQRLGLAEKKFTHVNQADFNRLHEKGCTRHEVMAALRCSKTTYFRRLAKYNEKKMRRAA